MDDEIGLIYNENNTVLCLALNDSFDVFNQLSKDNNTIYLGTKVLVYCQNVNVNVRSISREEVVQVYQLESKIREEWDRGIRSIDDSGRRPRPNLELLKKTGDILGLTKILTYEWGFNFSCDVSRAIEEFGEAAIGPLIASLKDKELSHRAAQGLFFIGEPAVQPLLKAVKEQGSDARGEAIWALGMIKDKRAVEAVIEALDDEDYFVRDRAAWALGRIEGKNAIEPLIKHLKDERYGYNRGAAMGLSEIGKDAVEALSEVLDDDDSEVRLGAVQALNFIYDESVIRLLRKAVNDGNHLVREWAREALGRKLGSNWQFHKRL